MWIALGIIGFIALLITVILLLPVYVIIQNDENNELILLYRFLGKTFGEDPDPNDPIVKTLKKAGGVERFEKDKLRTSIQTGGLKKTVAESYQVIVDLVKEIIALLKYGTITKLCIYIRCAGDDAADTAIRYGRYCAVTHGLLNALDAYVPIRKRKCKIDIGCDFMTGQEIFRYDVLLRVRFSHVLAAFWRLVLAEARRMAAERTDQLK